MKFSTSILPLLLLPVPVFGQLAADLVAPSVADSSFTAGGAYEVHGTVPALLAVRDSKGGYRILPAAKALSSTGLASSQEALESGIAFPVVKLGGGDRLGVLTPNLVVETTDIAATVAALDEEDDVVVSRIGNLKKHLLVRAESSLQTDAVAQIVESLAQVVSCKREIARIMDFKQLPENVRGGRDWYFANNGEGPSVLGADANLAEAYTYTPSGGGDDDFISGGTGIVIGVVDDGIAPAMRLYLPPGGLYGVQGEYNFVWEGPAGPGVGEEPPVTQTVDIPGGLNLNNDVISNPGGFPMPTRISQFHGTLTAQMIGGRNAGPSSVAPGIAYQSLLVPIRLTAGFREASDEARALTHRLTGDGAIEIFNNSWGVRDTVLIPQGLPPVVEAALETGINTGRNNNGAIYVFAGGNGGTMGGYSNLDGYANSPFTIAVGSFSDLGTQPLYAESGANLVISAPSVGGLRTIERPAFSFIPITGTDDDGALQFGGPLGANINEVLGYEQVVPSVAVGLGASTELNFEGSSASAAITSGVVALMLEVRDKELGKENPQITGDLSWRDVQDILITTAKKIDPNSSDWIENGADISFNHRYGAGAIDADAAVQEAATRDELLGERKVRTASVSFRGTEAGSLSVPDNEFSPVLQVLSIDSDDIEDSDDRTADENKSNLRVEHVELEVVAVNGRLSDIDITLISPSGTQSVLMTANPAANGEVISSYPFMTVRNWGESAIGNWVVRIRDRATGGNRLELLDLNLRVYGAVNDAPEPSDTPQILSDLAFNGVVGEQLVYDFVVERSNSITVTNLPDGLTFTPSDDGGGRISGVPTGLGGITPIAVTINGNGGSDTVTLVAVIRPFDTGLSAGIDLPSSSSVQVTSEGVSAWRTEINDIGTSANTPASRLDSLVSAPNLRDGTESRLQVSGLGRGVAMFRWGVSSEADSDLLWVNRGGEVPQEWISFIDGDVLPNPVAVPLFERSNRLHWIYTKDSENSSGADRGTLDELSVVSFAEYQAQMSDDGENLLNFPLLQEDGSLIPGTRTLWLPAIDNDLTDPNVLQTPRIGDGQITALSTWLDGVEDTTVNFRYFVSSEENEDELVVLLDGVEQPATITDEDGNVTAPDGAFAASGEVSWREASVSIPAAGARRYLQIAYRKNVSSSAGADLAQVDQVQVITTTSVMAQLANSSDGDSDGDGYSNLQELLFGGDPNKADTPAGLPKLVTVDGKTMLEFQISKKFSDVEYLFQRSTDLVNWDNVPLARKFRVASGEVDTFQFPTSSTGMDQLYYRVNPKISQ